ncbi:MAG: YitT family protein [Clostridium sp.]|nr:YitT family protein [Clostridium sp.]
MKNKIVQTIQEYVIIALGCTIMAAGVSLFLLPNELSTGGFSGIATIVYYFFKVPMGVTVLALNIPLLIIAYFKIGKQLFARSIYGTIVFSLMIDLIDKITPLTHDRFLGCIYGGIFAGIGTAIILKFDASTGGSDLLSHIIRAYKKQYKSSSLILAVDTVVIALNVIFFKNIEIGLYSAIAIFLMGKMIDLIFEGVNFAKVIFIISPKYEEIAGQISASINRGSTGLFSKGMYTDQEKLTLLCVGSRTEAYEMQSIAKEIDKEAFIIIMNAREVIGKGFNKKTL